MSSRIRIRTSVVLAATILAASSAATSGVSTGDLTLAEAGERTLRQSPDLAPFSAKTRAADARALQSGLRPNPELDFRIEDVLGSGAFTGRRQAEITVEVVQPIELGGKREARILSSERDRELAARGYENARADAMAMLAKRFVRVLAGQEIIDLATRQVETLERSLAAARRRVQAGAASRVEETRATIALARGRLLEEDSRHDLAIARTALAATWGEETPSFDRAVGSLAEREPPPRWEDVVARIEASPELTLLASEVALREAEATIAHTRRLPNLGLSAGFRRIEASDDHSLVFGLRVPLQLFDRNQHGIVEARAFADRAAADRAAAANRLRATLFELHQELVHSGHALEMLEGSILPNAERALDAVSRGYDAGTLSSIDLLDASRTATDVRRERVEAAETFQTLQIEIARLIGSPTASPSAEEVR